MSYRSREKKRKKRAAIGNVRVKHGEAMRSRHYLTIAKRTGSCNRCGVRLKKGGDLVFRKEPMEILCPVCAELLRIKYRTSRAWDRANRRRRSVS